VKCKQCKKTFTSKSSHARNVKFCSLHCRNKFYLPRVSAWARNKADRLASKPSPNKIQCLVCGKWYIQVCTHIFERHHLLAREYKKDFGLDVKRGKIPQWYRQVKAEICKENGTVLKGFEGKKYWWKKGSKIAGRYQRSEETMNRLKHK
jgi:hypothetical protein